MITTPLGWISKAREGLGWGS